MLVQLNRRSFAFSVCQSLVSCAVRSRCIWLLLCQSQPDTLASIGSMGLSSHVCSGQCATMLDLVGVTFGWCTMILCKALKQHIHQLCCNTVCRSARLTTRPLIVVSWHQGLRMRALMSLLCLPQMCMLIPQSAQSCRTIAFRAGVLDARGMINLQHAPGTVSFTKWINLVPSPVYNTHTALPQQAMCRE